MGAVGIRVTKKEEAGTCDPRRPWQLGRPVVDRLFRSISDDKVFPMVAPGAAIEEAFDQEDLDQRGAE